MTQHPFAMHARVSTCGVHKGASCRAWLHTGPPKLETSFLHVSTCIGLCASPLCAADPRILVHTCHHTHLQGIEVGPTDVMVHVRPCEGLVRQLDGTVEKRFAKTQLTVPLQVRP